MTKSLPPKPSIKFLKLEAKSILKAHKLGDSLCCEILRHLKQFKNKSDKEILDSQTSLQEVQFALAMEYGFKNWNDIKVHIERLDVARNNVKYWERGWGDTEKKKIQEICNDPEWQQLLDQEARISPLSKQAQLIRLAMVRMEPCHESFAENVHKIIQMSGGNATDKILDCGQASKFRIKQVADYKKSLKNWLAENLTDSPLDQKITSLLGKNDERKKPLVEHFIKKLDDASYLFGEDDWSKTEPMISHLEICCHYWKRNMTVTLEEIGSGVRKVGWHCIGGWGACGDAPDRSEEFTELINQMDEWLNGSSLDSVIHRQLGQQTPEKKWLLASLSKHIRCQKNMGRIVLEGYSEG